VFGQQDATDAVAATHPYSREEIMSRLFTGALTVVLIAAASPRIAAAQIEKGDSQISLQGSLSTTVGGSASNTSGSIGGQYGYYFTRQLALRGTAYINASSSSAGGGFDEFGDSGTEFSAIYGGGIELNLGTSGQKFVPYLAFDALTSSSATAGQSSVLLAPAFGARAFVSRNTAFNVALQYQTTSEATDVGTLQTSFGFSFFFGGDKRR
jgi:hypothetical protein